MSEKAKPRVYIGSSSRGLNYASAVQGHLSEVAQCTVWNNGVFPPGRATLEALELAIEERKFEYAVLILTPDDDRELDSVRAPVPRDNVLMELGLFMGRLGRMRTFALHHPRATLPTNLSGITTCPIEERDDGNTRAATLVGCERIREVIAGHLRGAVGTRPLSAPFAANLQGYRNISESGFVDRTRELIETSAEITFVGTGLNVLHSNGIGERIVERVREGKLTATICFGNPFAPAVRHRLAEEERGEFKPDVAAEGIITRVQSLLRSARGLPNLKVKLFNNYPTMSIFSFDSQRFVFYPMGYRKLGNQCPVMFVEQPGALGDFLKEMMKNYLDDAVDAREVFRVRVEHESTTEFVEAGGVCAAAVYIIPGKDDPCYTAGADLLGYDVLNGCPLGNSDDPDTQFFRSHVGGARDYGFHVSASDLMYIPKNQLPNLVTEVREVAGGGHRFDLFVRDVAVGKFGPHCVALECEEPSGQLERLLAEITVRIRSHALGTNFTLNRSRVRFWNDPMTDQEKTFLAAYQSPYVLSRFCPHFTLASPPKPPTRADAARLTSIVRKRFKGYLKNGAPALKPASVPVHALHVLSKPWNQQFWDPIRADHIVRLR